MPTGFPSIVVAGDVSIDRLLVPLPAMTSTASNWKLRTGTRILTQPGGSLLLADMVKAAVGKPTKVYCQHLEPVKLKRIAPERFINSLAELTLEEKVYRVSRILGFDGPEVSVVSIPPILDDDPKASLVVIDDVGNGFRDREASWPIVLSQENEKPIVLLKTFRPLARGPLWKFLQERHSERLIVVIDADDLRLAGMNISRRLSWERTALDFAWHIANDDAFKELAACSHLVVRFGLDGAILRTNVSQKVDVRLFFDSRFSEDSLADNYQGMMIGHTTAFVASLAAQIQAGGLGSLRKGIRKGLRVARYLLEIGFGTSPENLSYPVGKLFSEEAHTDYFVDIKIPSSGEDSLGQPIGALRDGWSAVTDVNPLLLEDAAYEIVRAGNTALMRKIPLGIFGALKTADRIEIESYQSIRNLIQEYLNNSAAAQPISIAVFGRPGSGKSFGVSEVARTVGKNRIQNITFNVAQFTSVEDLVNALQEVRDIAIKGKVPLVFFDEFDATFGSELGWLKYFLAPMQDGEFRDGARVHPIGKAIFVFAGGTAFTFQEFCGEDINDQEKRKGFEEIFAQAKGTDFVSRLRGYVNILGPNPQSEADNFCMIRRALLLRLMLERKAKHLIDESTGRAYIDQGVLSAMIKTSCYHHGARSMQAILEMSLLSGRKAFEPAALPSPEQLAMHVEADEFLKLVRQDVNWSEHCEKLAMAVQEVYRETQKNIKPAADPAVQPWSKLGEHFKESCRQQAMQIPSKLRAIGLGIRPAQGTPSSDLDEFTKEQIKEQIEYLSEMEHDRFVNERFQAGWRIGPERKTEKKISNALIPWDDLDESVKEYDRDFVRSIPSLLEMARFEVFKLEQEVKFCAK
jgi:hypothetical protein